MKTFNRDKAIVRLRKAAERALKSPRRGYLESAWRAFPENYRDGLPTPTPLDILTICDRLDREKLEDDAFARALRK